MSVFSHCGWACLLMLTAFAAQAQGKAKSLPPIFAATPRHLARATVVASFPPKTFLENLTVEPSGQLLVTSLDEGLIYRIAPDGQKAVFARLKAKIAGIAPYGSQEYLVTAWDEQGAPAVYLVDARRAVRKLATIPGARFLNGLTALTARQYLIADSYRGCIWLFDVPTRRATVWLASPLLARADTLNPTPGVNGLKLRQGVLYASNTQRQLLLKIPVRQLRAGQPAVFVKAVNIDDFAFDKAGTLYGTTHIYNSVVAISPAGRVSVIAEGREGVSGSTALAFGRRPADAGAVYVITNGGMSLPPPSGIEAAKVVRLTLAP